MQKYSRSINKEKTISSICITGILMALIVVVNFGFEMFKVWQYSIQVFLVVYAIGIYKIRNLIVNVVFILCVPPIIFAMEKNVYAINGIQVFFEYFLAFYIFGLLLIPRYIYEIVFVKWLRKKNVNSNLIYLIDVSIFCFFFSLLIIIKYLFHAVSSLAWWGSDNYLAALIYNLPWLFTNLLLIPIVIITSLPLFKLFDKYNKIQENKF